MDLTLIVNGQDRVICEQSSPSSLLEVVISMGLKADQIAIEHNGAIAPRGGWSEIPVASGDRLEIVHFVGGGVAMLQGSAKRNTTIG